MKKLLLLWLMIAPMSGMAQNESTYSNAGNQSVQYAIRTVTQYIYKFGKEVGIY